MFEGIYLWVMKTDRNDWLGFAWRLSPGTTTLRQVQSFASQILTVSSEDALANRASDVWNKLLSDRGSWLWLRVDWDDWKRVRSRPVMLRTSCVCPVRVLLHTKASMSYKSETLLIVRNSQIWRRVANESLKRRAPLPAFLLLAYCFFTFIPWLYDVWPFVVTGYIGNHSVVACNDIELLWSNVGPQSINSHQRMRAYTAHIELKMYSNL